MMCRVMAMLVDSDHDKNYDHGNSIMKHTGRNRSCQALQMIQHDRNRNAALKTLRKHCQSSNINGNGAAYKSMLIITRSKDRTS